MEALTKVIRTSDSLQRLRDINTKIPERHFHDHSHILYDVRTLLGSSKAMYLESGSYVRSSACLMLSHVYPTDVICIDPLWLPISHYKGTADQKTTLERNMQAYAKNREYKIIQGLSHSREVLGAIKECSIDILFIDGDHSRAAVLRDFANYRRFVKHGGFIIFDDYQDKQHSPQVKGAVDEIVRGLQPGEVEVIGSIPNFQNASPTAAEAKRFAYSNEFILRKM